MSFDGDKLEVLVDALLTNGASQAILNQEKRGQNHFVNSATLPKKCNNCTREQLEQIGIVFLDDCSDLFVSVQLPNNWKKESTDHSRWSKLIDENGNERASIFFKAALYDRNAFVNLVCRFSAHVEPVLGWKNSKESKWCCFVNDCKKVIWASATLRKEPEDRDKWSIWIKEKSSLRKLGVNWLDENYPDWKNPIAYW